MFRRRSPGRPPTPVAVMVSGLVIKSVTRISLKSLPVTSSLRVSYPSPTEQFTGTVSRLHHQSIVPVLHRTVAHNHQIPATPQQVSELTGGRLGKPPGHQLGHRRAARICSNASPVAWHARGSAVYVHVSSQSQVRPRRLHNGEQNSSTLNSL